jgi:hypothetical protein
LIAIRVRPNHNIFQPTTIAGPDERTKSEIQISMGKSARSASGGRTGNLLPVQRRTARSVLFRRGQRLAYEWLNDAFSRAVNKRKVQF